MNWFNLNSCTEQWIRLDGPFQFYDFNFQEERTGLFSKESMLYVSSKNDGNQVMVLKSSHVGYILTPVQQEICLKISSCWGIKE